PILFLTGHGTVSFTDAEAGRLRSYLENGGFLYVDDDYGLDASIRKELKKVFPRQELRELPFSHPVFHAHFDFPGGVPKTHEHDAKVPQTFALFDGDRVCVLYTFESNPSDGWADPEVHGDPQNKRLEALRFGTNIVVYALGQRSAIQPRLADNRHMTKSCRDWNPPVARRSVSTLQAPWRSRCSRSSAPSLCSPASKPSCMHRPRYAP
ncbi:MAG: DUF4159 domain-containing protein, partial [Candidatus Kapaibacterium sp.]